MRWDIAIIIFVILAALIWGPTIVPLTIGQKLTATVAAAISAVLVPMLHPALRDD